MSDLVDGKENFGISSLLGGHSLICVFLLFFNISAHSTLHVCYSKKASLCVTKVFILFRSWKMSFDTKIELQRLWYLCGMLQKL